MFVDNVNAIQLQMETLDAAKEDNEVIASVSLLSMGIKTVPEAVLRRKFGDTANVLIELMKRFADTENQNVLRSVGGFVMLGIFFHLFLISFSRFTGHQLYGSPTSCAGIFPMDIVVNFRVFRCHLVICRSLQTENTQVGSTCHRFDHSWQ